MKNNSAIAYAEVDQILNMMEDEYVEKIPDKVRNFFTEQKDTNYTPEIQADKSLNEQNLQRDTLVLLAILNLNYWCETEEEKQEFTKQLDENEKKHEKDLQEKYSIERIFKERNEKNENTEMKKSVDLIEVKKPNFFQRFINALSKFFKKK